MASRFLIKTNKKNKQTIYIYIYIHTNKYNHPWNQPCSVIFTENALHFYLAGILRSGSSREIHLRWSSLFGVLRCGRWVQKENYHMEHETNYGRAPFIQIAKYNTVGNDTGQEELSQQASFRNSGSFLPLGSQFERVRNT